VGSGRLPITCRPTFTESAHTTSPNSASGPPVRTTRNTGWDALGAFEAVRGHTLSCEYRYLQGGAAPAGYVDRRVMRVSVSVSIGRSMDRRQSASFAPPENIESWHSIAEGVAPFGMSNTASVSMPRPGLMSSLQELELRKLVASYSLPLMMSFWFLAEKLRASLPTLVTRSLTVKNSPLACSAPNVSCFDASPRLVPSTSNSNLPSRTGEPAGATAGADDRVGADRVGADCVLYELPEDESDRGTVDFFSLLLPRLPRTTSARTAAPIPPAHFQFHCFLAGLGGCTDNFLPRLAYCSVHTLPSKYRSRLGSDGSGNHPAGGCGCVTEAPLCSLQFGGRLRMPSDMMIGVIAAGTNVRGPAPGWTE